ncbi:MAG TPA: cytochrome b/b6 domain-containing protein [bacterium]
MAGTEEENIKKESALAVEAGRNELIAEQLKNDVISEIQAKLKKSKTEIPAETKEKILQSTVNRLNQILPRKIGRLKQELVDEAIRAAAKSQKEIAEIAKKEEKTAEETFLRFNIHFRIQHMMLFSSVILLILTGLPLKFPAFSPFAFLVDLFGGIESSRFFHRFAAVILILFMVYHTLYTILHRDGRRDFLLLLPMPKDIKDVIWNLKYFFGLSDDRPKFGRFSYVEKFDYWAVYWGCVIMIGSGALLWFQDISLMFLPKFALDASKEAHSDEAVLATLAIVIWHFYNVHFNPDKFPGSLLWLHGRIPKDEMMEEHPLEYAELMKQKENQHQVEKSNDTENT